LDLYARLVSLPLYPAMTEEQVNRVAAVVKKIVHSTRRTRVIARAASRAGEAVHR
jgi:uncharacterized protein (UPF0147 family)